MIVRELLERAGAATASPLTGVWNSERVARVRVDLAEKIAGAHLDHIVAGQDAVATCGCGERIARWHGDWFHVLNPALRGTDDHWAEPGTETVLTHPHWKPADEEDY